MRVRQLWVGLLSIRKTLKGAHQTHEKRDKQLQNISNWTYFVSIFAKQ